jgi:hypothetical protein
MNAYAVIKDFGLTATSLHTFILKSGGGVFPKVILNGK